MHRQKFSTINSKQSRQRTCKIHLQQLYDQCYLFHRFAHFNNWYISPQAYTSATKKIHIQMFQCYVRVAFLSSNQHMSTMLLDGKCLCMNIATKFVRTKACYVDLSNPEKNEDTAVQ